MNLPRPTSNRLAGPLWAVTTFYNPAGYRRRKINYRLFREHLDLPLLTVEWSRDARFELGPGDADVLIQLDGGDVMWQKERLLNIGIARLPACCTHVMWIDCDVIFGQPVADATLAELARVPLVQPFKISINQGRLPIDALQAPGAWRDAPVVQERVGWGYYHCEARARGDGVAYRVPSPDARFSFPAAVGRAWAASRKFLEENPLLDAWIVGGGDGSFIYAAHGNAQDNAQLCGLSPAHARHYLRHAQRLSERVAGRVSFVDATVYHLWHGDAADRRYRERYAILERHGFDPDRDLDTDPSTGVWRWRHADQPMAAEVADYFASRFEDGRDAPGA
jgi:hypothetical protein